MKKIMFNDKYGLTQAVLEGRKTMTRRIATALNHQNITDISEWGVDNNGNAMLLITYDTGLEKDVYPHFQIGEEVAVSQAYSSIFDELEANVSLQEARPILEQSESAGWDNKMFVKASLMLHRICITDIKVERLQDISEEDAMREGVFKYDKPPLHHEADMFAPWAPHVRPYKFDSDNLVYRCTARYAFAYLIDKISGGGTWNRNPWVFAYEFEFVK